MWKTILCLGLLGLGQWPLLAEEFEYHHENVLGTVAELRIHADSRLQAEHAENVILTEIDRLCAIFSTYQPQSEVNCWMDSRLQQPISSELRELLTLCDRYQTLSQGTFTPRISAATLLWRSAATAQKLPTADALNLVVECLKQPAWEIDQATGQAQFMGDPQGRLNFDAIGKGLIIDKACELALKQAGVHGLVVNIGGDLRIAGSADQVVSIAPKGQEATILGKIRLQNRSVATSGGCCKYFEIGTQKYSHLIDPRTAQPISHLTSVTVIAATATAADTMATSLSVMSVPEALAWCEQHPAFACLIVDPQGQTVQSNNWPKMASFTAPSSDEDCAEGDWPKTAKLAVSFEINNPATTRYRRPYVAVWIEDRDGIPIRTLVLWIQEGRGARWHPDLKRWYKQETLRKLVAGNALIGTISAPTRPPGRYTAIWDGKDDQGKLVSLGNYTLYIEAAREHGTYQLIRQPLVLGAKALKGNLTGNTEIKAAAYEYTPR